MSDIRHCCSLFVCPIVETPQHQQNAAFHWPTARLLLEDRAVTFAVSFLSFQNKQIRIPIIFCLAKKNGGWVERKDDIGLNRIQIAERKWRNMREEKKVCFISSVFSVVYFLST